MIKAEILFKNGQLTKGFLRVGKSNYALKSHNFEMLTNPDGFVECLKLELTPQLQSKKIVTKRKMGSKKKA